MDSEKLSDELSPRSTPEKIQRGRFRSKNPRPSPSLPCLRLLLCPKAGLGLDARLPLTKLFKCFLSLEAYFQGSSTTRFGIESNHFPFLRLDLAPAVRLSIRPSPIRFTDLKFGVLGGLFTLYDSGNVPTPDFSSAEKAWRSLQPFTKPVLEINQRNTLFGTFANAGQRKGINDVINKIINKERTFPDKMRQSREAILESLHQQELPPLDPRLRKDAHEEIKERMRKELEQLKNAPNSFKPAHTHWPGVSRDEEGTESTLNVPKDGPSVVGHVKPGKDGRLELHRSDGAIAGQLHNDAIRSVTDNGGPFARFTRGVRARFSNSRSSH